MMVVMVVMVRVTMVINHHLGSELTLEEQSRATEGTRQ